MTLRRGFKAEAERLALALREQLGVSRTAPLDLEPVARTRGIKIISADELVSLRRLEELERIQAFAFSACTFEINSSIFIVVNPLRSQERRRSDIAHELSHLLLDHDLSEIRDVAGVPFRTCRPQQEEEATALGGTLLLPRPLLLAAAKKGWEIDQIAKHYGVTIEMARYRYNTTGVAKQINRLQAPA